MKGCKIMGIGLMVLALGARAIKNVDVTFGPSNCVSLSRSSAGSCVLATDCEGVDISKTEFAFDCIAQSGSGDVVRHSFGIGGFEASEEFDTEVKCGRCAHVHPAEPNEPAKKAVKKVDTILRPAPPPAVPVTPAPVHSIPVLKPKPKHEETVPGAVAFRAQAGVKSKAKFWPFTSSKKADVVRYGPDKCVSTYRSEEGNCIMETACTGSKIKDYEFGLVCVDKVGSPVKHLFGKDSFDSEETFDTLIKCKQCLGLEDVPDQVVLAGEVATMAKDIGNLKNVLKNISINVQMLNAKIFPAPPAPAGPAPAPAPAKVDKALIHQSVSHHRHRGNLRRSHRHHHRRRDDDDDDEEDDRGYGEELSRVVEVPAKVVEAPMNNVEKAEKEDDDDDDGEDGNDED